MKLLSINLLLLAALFTQPLAYAGFNEGAAAYQKGDYSTAFKEFKPLAEQGDADAQSRLGFMYEQGKGVAQDDKQAVSWTRKAADQGDALAQTSLGFMYAEGQGVAQDDKQAVSWYRKATDQGNYVAQSKLGAIYVLGKGVAQDFVHAHMWFNIASANGNTDARSNRDMVANRMSPAQLEKAQELAGEWMRQHGN